ncbi:helix-turn-helix domain-containing protein [Gracilibacillus oryzae]|uniref:Helix-turn-helix domain-containing protein n=2 Tax=Gracilibacillus oryzae TaxID=1672701 RepID=A0A7C8KMT3_9BACI|nr:helix-turn-helix domain-containing protein [Gracilibacillus oryzae]
MTTAIYELTAKQIEKGFQEKDESIIEKETDYILSRMIRLMLQLFPDKIKAISFEKSEIHWDVNYLLSEKNHKNLNKWLLRMKGISMPPSDEDFGKLKVDLENWYYQLTGGDLLLEYRTEYLLTPKQACELMGISRTTLNKYIQQGLEISDTDSHKKIPRYVIELWKDPVYAIRMQMLVQEKKRLRQSTEQRLHEINKELKELNKKYKTESIFEAFADFNGDEMNDPTDYYIWKDLLEEKEDILK